MLSLLLALSSFIAFTAARRPLGRGVATLPRSGSSALRSRGRADRGHSLGTVMSALAGITHHRALTDAFENMRPEFDDRAIRCDGSSGKVWNTARFGAGAVGHIRAVGRRADVRSRNPARFGTAHIGRIRPGVGVCAGLRAIALLQPIAGNIARIRTSARSDGALQALRFVAAKFASRVGPYAGAAEFLAQHRVPIGNAAAVAGIMVPATRWNVRNAGGGR